MEAHAEAVEARRRAEQELRPEAVDPPRDERRASPPEDPAEEDTDPVEPPLLVELNEYEYREILDEDGENYLLPQWMINFFSSGDICHTLDASDNVICIAKLNDARTAEAERIDISAECDMSTQTVALKVCFGEGASSEMLKTKFYLFERGDLFELGRLVRQPDLRIDVLARGADYSLSYARSVRVRVPQSVASQLKNILSKIPA
jgi:hypothetical protein